VLSPFGTSLAEQKAGQHVSACNAPPASANSFVSLPGHPFGVVPTGDGCSLFVSIVGDSKAANGTALLQRAGGGLILKHVLQVEGLPLGMVMTHDGKLLVVAAQKNVVFMDVDRMLAEPGGDPILGSISDGASAGSVYVNVTADDGFLFVS